MPLLYHSECDESMMDFDDFDFFKTAYSGVYPVLNIALNNFDLYNFDINSADRYGNTLLHIICQQGKEEIVLKLLSLGANPNILNKRSQTPLTIACATGHLKIIQHLMANNAKTNIKNIENENLLFTCVRYNELYTLKFLTKKYPKNMNDLKDELNDLNETLVHIAAKNNNFEILKFLIIKLGLHVYINHVSIIGETPLQIAVEKSNLEIVKFLIGNEATLNIFDNKARTLLHIAILKRNLNVFKFLINCENSVDVNCQDFEGATALHYAVDLNEHEIVQILLSKSAKINIFDFDGYTPLHVASLNSGNIDVLKLLLKFGADCNLETNEGDFPLHLAAASGNFKGSMLLNSCLNVNSLNKSGFSPVQLAVDNKHEEIVEVLLNRGGRKETINSESPAAQTKIPVKTKKSGFVGGNGKKGHTKVPKIVRY